VKRSFRRALLVLLVCFALLFGFAACGRPSEPSPAPLPEIFPPQEASEESAEESSPLPEESEPPAEEPPVEEPPLGFSPPDWMEQEITQGNAALDENFQWLMDNREEVLTKLNQKLLSFREGTFEEMPNHHAPWREDFPSPMDVKYPLTYDDYVVYMSMFEPIDETSYTGGELVIWVKLDDQNHYMVQWPAWFSSSEWDGRIFGFSDSGFYKGEPHFDFDEWMLVNKNRHPED